MKSQNQHDINLFYMLYGDNTRILTLLHCSHSLHEYDVFRVLKLCIEEQGEPAWGQNVDVTTMVCTLVHHSLLLVISVEEVSLPMSIFQADPT